MSTDRHFFDPIDPAAAFMLAEWLRSRGESVPVNVTTAILGYADWTALPFEERRRFMLDMQRACQNWRASA